MENKEQEVEECKDYELWVKKDYEEMAIAVFCNPYSFEDNKEFERNLEMQRQLTRDGYVVLNLKRSPFNDYDVMMTVVNVEERGKRYQRATPLKKEPEKNAK